MHLLCSSRCAGLISQAKMDVLSYHSGSLHVWRSIVRNLCSHRWRRPIGFVGCHTLSIVKADWVSIFAHKLVSAQCTIYMLGPDQAIFLLQHVQCSIHDQSWQANDAAQSLLHLASRGKVGKLAIDRSSHVHASFRTFWWRLAHRQLQHNRSHLVFTDAKGASLVERLSAWPRHRWSLGLQRRIVHWRPNQKRDRRH